MIRRIRANRAWVLSVAALLAGCGNWREDRLLSAEFVYRAGRDPKGTRSASVRGYFERHREELTAPRSLSWWGGYAASPLAPTRAAAAYALGEARRLPSSAFLRPLLKDPDGEVRCAAAEAWGKLPRSVPLGPLLRASRDPDGWVRQAACQALGRLGNPEGVTALRARLADPNGLVRAAAALALGQLRPQRAELDLTPLLKDSNGAVRQAAELALQALRRPGRDSAP